MNEKKKVLAYIHRDWNGKKEILVFDHVEIKDAGTQVIGRTVEEWEGLREALLREILEESGLVFHIVDVHPLGKTVYQRKDIPELNHRHYFQIDGSHLEEEWSHRVDSLGEDHNLIFQFYWIDIPTAKMKLVGVMHELLDQL